MAIMNATDSIAVRRPQRWDEPMDPHLRGEDVAWLLKQMPFAALDASAFPKSIPLSGVLQNDCRLHRVTAGQVIVREGDYANSAFLVLDGCVDLVTQPMPAEVLGRRPARRIGWAEAVKRFLLPSGVRESRRVDQVTPGVEFHGVGAAESDSPHLFLQDFDAIVRRGETVSLGPGELFGEVAAMYRSPRTATVVAPGNATLLEIRLQGLKMLRRDAAFAQRLEDHYRSTWLPLHLREVPLLRHLPPANMARVVAATQLQSFGRLEWNADYKKTRKLLPAEQIAQEPILASEGHHVTDLIIVRSGFGRVCRSYGAAERTVSYVGKGHCFGLEEIALSVIAGEDNGVVALRNSLRAVGFLDTLHIPVECFATEILPHVRRSELPPAAAQALLAKPAQQKRERRAAPRGDRGAKSDQSTWRDLPTPSGTQFQPTGLLEFIVQNRFNNGLQAMVIDLHRCTRCDDCVKACATVHDGNPRFARVGPHHERLQVVQACMHCADPVCMIGCPTGAIHRNETTGVVEISEPICIGCGVCATSCPYDTIEMVGVRDPSGRAYLDAHSNKPITKATKCDMCSGLPSGPACTAACPHDAIVRIDLNESPPLEEWLRRRT